MSDGYKRIVGTRSHPAAMGSVPNPGGKLTGIGGYSESDPRQLF